MSEHDENEVFLRSPDVRRRYGNCSAMWLHRRVKDPASGFPQPITIGRFKYWRLSDLVAFERAAAARPPVKLYAPERPRRTRR